MSSDTYLQPPRNNHVNPDHIIPLSPPGRPPFERYHTASTLPATPRTPYAPVDEKNRTAVAGERGLQPYLGLLPRLLLVTLIPALLPLILSIAHLLQNRSSTAALADTLKNSVLSACNGLADGAASIQTLPRYMAMQTNKAAVLATQASILAVGAGLIDCITIIEKVIEFIIDTYRSLLMCTIQLAVQGVLDILIEAVQTISDSVTGALNSIRTSIQNDIASANSVIQSTVSSINSVTSKLGVNISVPEFSIPELSALENVTIPTTFEDSLIKLNNSMPNLDELRTMLNDLVDTPFEELKSSINSTRLEMAASFNETILPTVSLQTLAASDSSNLQNELCNGLDTSLIDDTANALHKLSNVAIGLMFLLLFLCWAALCVWEWYRWRAMKQTVEAVQMEMDRGQTSAWRMVAVVEHPILERYGTRILDRFTQQDRTRNNIRWFFSYLAHPTCLALLLIASLGFLSLQFQMIALDAIKDHARKNANSTVTATTNSLTSKLNALAANSSLQYANEFNAAVNAYEQRINDELFGTWINSTAVTLNSTLVEFYDKVEDLLDAAFGNSTLGSVINTFVYCILGSKITNLEEGLTWVSQHAQVTLPTLSTDVLMLSNSSMNELVSPVVAAAVGSNGSGGSSSNSSADSSDQDGAIGSLIAHFESALRYERNFYAILLGVWLGFALIGIIVVIWHSGGKERYQRWRGIEVVEDVSQSKWRWTGGHPISDQYNEEKQFRGTTPPMPMPVPTITETDADGQARPANTRQSTLGLGSIHSLAAPGQAFLRLTGWRSSSAAGDDTARLQYGSSEKYTAAPAAAARARGDREEVDSRAETPPPFWVNKFYKAVETARSAFPTRGMRLGAALRRNASQRTENSFGASRMASAQTPRDDWPSQQEHAPRGRSPFDDETGEDGRWSMMDPQTIGRALDGSDLSSGYGSDVRYPADARPAQQLHPPPAAHAQAYPRPMSRAPTPRGGRAIQRSFALDQPPPLPLKSAGAGGAQGLFVPPAAFGKHDSVDYLQSDEEDDEHGESHAASPTPTSSSRSWFSEPTVEVASRAQTGTAALAAVFAGIQRRQAAEDGRERARVDPFETPFDDHHEV